MKSKKGERMQLVLDALEKRGKPGTVNDIEKLLPEAFRMSNLDATRVSCRKLYLEGKLKRWGGPRGKRMYVYGLPQMEGPKEGEIPLVGQGMRDWVSGKKRLQIHPIEDLSRMAQ